VSLDALVKDAWGIPVLRFDYQFGDNEIRMAKDMADSAEEMLRAAGAENIKIERELLPPGWSIHEIGTAQLAEARRFLAGSSSTLPSPGSSAVRSPRTLLASEL
jgi:hypothetical protein